MNKMFTAIKIAFAGLSNVGKTYLINKIIGKTADVEPTIGVDMCLHKTVIGSQDVLMEISDISGATEFRSFVCEQLKGEAVVFLVYSPVVKGSFDFVKQIISDMEKDKSNSQIVAIICNKSEKQDDAEMQLAKQLATAHGYSYILLQGSKGTSQVDEFLKVIEKVLKQISSKTLTPNEENGVYFLNADELESRIQILGSAFQQLEGVEGLLNNFSGEELCQTEVSMDDYPGDGAIQFD